MFMSLTATPARSMSYFSSKAMEKCGVQKKSSGSISPSQTHLRSIKFVWVSPGVGILGWVSEFRYWKSKPNRTVSPFSNERRKFKIRSTIDGDCENILIRLFTSYILRGAECETPRLPRLTAVPAEKYKAITTSSQRLYELNPI